MIVSISPRRDAMPGGGLISVEAALVSERSTITQVDIRCRRRRNWNDSETMVRAFDPFFTTKGEGLGGVGLPMVKRFAEESGGTPFVPLLPAPELLWNELAALSDRPSA
ncbi:hypothetical protein [Mesorhizobium sp. 43Arga]